MLGYKELMTTNSPALSLGTAIRAFRARIGMTLPELAAATGSDAGHLSKVERGKTGVSPGLLIKIADALGVTVSDLYNGDVDVVRRPASPQNNSVAIGKQSVTLDLSPDCLVVWRQLQALPPEQQEEWRARLDIAAATARLARLGRPPPGPAEQSDPPLPVPKPKRTA